MATSLECLPAEETQLRWQRARRLMQALLPDAGGLLLSSPLTIYYFTGTLGSGLFWLPLEGEPVLLVRKGLERTLLESPLRHIRRFRSYKELPGLCAEEGSPLPDGKSASVAVDMKHFSWEQSGMLMSRVPSLRFVPGDAVVARTRAVKTPWELNKMRLAGERHNRCMREVLPGILHPGMSEREISLAALAAFNDEGHGGMVRLSGGGVSPGSASVGESGLYATNFDGPLGTRGLHPSLPFAGDAGTIWKRGQLLTLDMGFVLEGYNTDKTQTYWAGSDPVDPEVQRAHDVCEEILHATSEALKPGAVPSAIWQRAQEQAAAAGYGEQFMGVGPERVRFLGHGIGLNMDEFPAFAKGFDLPLEEGMTVALEPKIGLPGLGMPGVENTFEITADGARSLSGTDWSLIVIG
ncbi:MAG: aminopeptidase P family protein [Desulfovibrionaceae bacterium]|nr:aminopeptidase P family protein [Desulfovibrionaceae bacterium]